MPLRRSLEVMPVAGELTADGRVGKWNVGATEGGMKRMVFEVIQLPYLRSFVKSAVKPF